MPGASPLHEKVFVKPLRWGATNQRLKHPRDIFAVPLSEFKTALKLVIGQQTTRFKPINFVSKCFQSNPVDHTFAAYRDGLDYLRGIIFDGVLEKPEHRFVFRVLTCT
jgi:hypothetical protein